MSYTDYLKRMAINRPKVIDTQMRMPDASSFTWRTKMLATQINRRTDHVINNSQDLGIAPRLFSPAVAGYRGSGAGGKVQDASSYTMSLGATATGRDRFRAADGTTRMRISTVNADGSCIALPPASQVVSERGNINNSLNFPALSSLPPSAVTIWNNTGSNMSWKSYSSKGLNMGYTAQRVNSRQIPNVGVCTQRFFPYTESQFVDRIPDLLTHKIGTKSRMTGLQRDNAQNPINCRTTNTSGNIKGNTRDSNEINIPELKADQPYNSYSARPFNPATSLFITGVQGSQVGGSEFPGGRADKVGGATPKVTRMITHRGWGGRTRIPYPYTGANGNQPQAPAQLKINDPNHYKP